MNEAALEAVRGGLQPLGTGTLFGMQKRRDVAPEMFVHQRCPVHQRALGIGQRLQRFKVRLDQFQRVLGDVAAVGDDQRECLADIAQLVVRDQRLVGNQDVGIDPVAPALRSRRPASR